MEIKIVIDQKSFDKGIGETINARVKNVLRNDKQLKRLIITTVASEVSRLVHASPLLSEMKITDMRDAMIKDIAKETIKQTGSDLYVKFRNEFSLQLCSVTWDELIKKQNTKKLQTLFSKEIVALKKEKRKTVSRPKKRKDSRNFSSRRAAKRK